MARRQGTNSAPFHELLTSFRGQTNLQEIRRQLRAGASATFNLSVPRVLAENYAGRLAGVLPSPAGLALQCVLFLAEAVLQALDNTAAAASLPDQLRHVKEHLHRLEGLGPLPEHIQRDIDRVTYDQLLPVSVVVDDLRTRPRSGWWKCTSCLHALVCAKCNAQKLNDVAGILSKVLTQINGSLVEIIAHRIERPAECVPELPPHLDAGMRQRVSKVMEFLRMNTSASQSVRVVGLHGEGGIGKTTLMYAVHEQLKQDQSKQTCGTIPIQPHKIATVEVGMTPPPSTELQQKLFSQLSDGIKLAISTADQGKSELTRQLRNLQSERKPVCIFLDDVWEYRHLHDLLPGNLARVLPGGSYMMITSRSADLLPGNLARVLPGGSYMMITSRSADVVRGLGLMCFESEKEQRRGYLDYQLELLDKEDAVTLFLKNASRQGERRPLSRGDELVEEVVPLCGGLPLALAMYGAFFKDEGKRHDWRSVCRKMRAAEDLSAGEKRVFAKLKLSIEIQSEPLKDAFLDVALFFNRNEELDRDTIKRVMEEEDYIDSLVEQSLVRVRDRGEKVCRESLGRVMRHGEKEVVVHDLLRLVAQRMAKDKRIAISVPTSEHEQQMARWQLSFHFSTGKLPISPTTRCRSRGCDVELFSLGDHQALPQHTPLNSRQRFFGRTTLPGAGLSLDSKFEGAHCSIFVGCNHLSNCKTPKDSVPITVTPYYRKFTVK